MRTRLPMLVVAGGAMLAGAVGCGSSSPPSAPSSSTASVTVEHGAYAHCLGEHGVTETAAAPAGPQPGPAAAPAGVDPGTWSQATEACASLAPGPAGP